jgi:hypothetical protein
MAASFQFTPQGFPFKASAGWAQDFKKEHRIRYGHMTKYISSKGNTTFEETVKAPEFLQKQTVTVIPDYDLDYVINTDQTRCKHRENKITQRRGKKRTSSARYTQNYAFLDCTICITKSSKLLPIVFICLQDRSSTLILRFLKQ